MDSVYSTGMGKSRQIPKIEPEAVFFSLPGLGEGIPQRSPPPPTQPVVSGAGCLKVAQFSVVLTIFTAEVDVNIDQKLSAELHRSMRKNPPRTLKYELIYVCNPATPVTGDANIPFRRGRRSMTQARKRMKLSPRQRVAFSKACAQT
jgi:hypothetical protein